jgi:dTDP-4-amino-4,6-dideoxygalactose transaminase
MISFHVPYTSPCELQYLTHVVENQNKSSNGEYYQRNKKFIQQAFNFPHSIFTNSCTDALEFAAILLEIKPGDEVILPSFTFVSTANAFLLRGATLVFCDSCADNPNIQVEHLKTLITPKTKAVIVVHYGGRSCDMLEIMALSCTHNFFVVEDAAQCIGAKNATNQFLGTQGHLSTFSFHDTKNLHCGEGGMLVINEPSLVERAEIIKDKGTNRNRFLQGEIDKYTWVDIGSSYLPSEYCMAVLFAQLQDWETITHKRITLWNKYYARLGSMTYLLPPKTAGNAHNFYLVLPSVEIRTSLIEYLKSNQIQSAFHYQPLHTSPMITKNTHGISPISLPNAEKFGNGLLRLPLYPQLKLNDVDKIADVVLEWAKINSSF